MLTDEGWKLCFSFSFLCPIQLVRCVLFVILEPTDSTRQPQTERMWVDWLRTFPLSHVYEVRHIYEWRFRPGVICSFK